MWVQLCLSFEDELRPEAPATGLAWVAQQITRMESRAVRKPRFNPSPPGVIKAGSTTHEVLQFLLTNPHKVWTISQMKKHIDRPEKTISWSLHFLKVHGYVRVVSDRRNSRYQRYLLSKRQPGHQMALIQPNDKR